VTTFKIVEEFQKHHPGKQRQAIRIAIEALVLAQDLTRRFDQRGKLLGGGECGLGGFLGTGHGAQFRLRV
jgi:hypothetical protein